MVLGHTISRCNFVISTTKRDWSWKEQVLYVPEFMSVCKGNNHVAIVTDAEKAFDKTQHPFIINTLNKVGLKGDYLNMAKAV